jgi:hypothetical protein
VDDLCFQQDGATCHTSNETIAILQEKFPDRVLTPLDLFLWGHVKDKVYANVPRSIQDLKDGIREVSEDIQPNFMKKICC